MKWFVDGYILNVHFVYDALSDTLTFDGQSNSIGLTGDKSHACDVVKEKIYCGTEYVRDVKISNAEIVKDNCEHCSRNDYFAFNFSKTVTIIKAMQIKNFTSTLYNRWQKFEKIKPNENPINESWTDYYDYCKWYTSLVTTFGNFLVQNYIKVQGKKPYEELESDINSWFNYIKEKYKVETKVETFDNIMNIEDFFRALMLFCSDFKISGHIEYGNAISSRSVEDDWNEELKFVDRGLVL